MNRPNYLPIVCILMIMVSFAFISYSNADSETNINATTTETNTPPDITTNPASIAEWSNENTYWRNNYNSRPYYIHGTGYTDYEPAYQYGVDAYNQYPDKAFDDFDSEQLQQGWNERRGSSTLDWSHARDAMRDAYNRIHNNITPNSGTNSTRLDAGTSSDKK